MMPDFAYAASESDHPYVQQGVLNSLSMQPTISSEAYLPTKLALTAEGFLGDRRLVELSALRDDWDGYGGAALDRRVIDSSREYFAMLLARLPAPDIQPNTNGTVSFEWTAPRGVAQLEIGNTKLSLYVKPNSGEPIFLMAPSATSVVAHVRNLIASTLFGRTETEMTGAASFGRKGDWVV